MGEHSEQTSATASDSRKPSRTGPVSKVKSQRAAKGKRKKQVRGPYRDTGRAQRVIDFLEKLTTPSGKGQGGPFIQREFQRKFIRDIYEPHGPDGYRLVRKAIDSIARKNGKALSLETKLPTPAGWCTMGDIKVGDELFDDKGDVCRVIFATPVQINRECYRVDFADGASIVADADHQWTVYSRSRHGRKLTLTTLDMVGSVNLPYGRDGYSERDYSVDVAKPITCPEVDLPVPPYTLGAWLGDGVSSGARMVCAENDAAILEKIKAEGVPVKRQKATNRIAVWSFSDGVRNRAKDCIQSRLKSLGLIKNKHIPIVYQRASRPQRMELLRGMMDTDGYASRAGQCEYVSVSEILARDFLHLVRGLGFKSSIKEDRARLNGRDCGARYRIQFWAYADTPVFYLPRKAERLKENSGKTRNNRNYIVGIHKTTSVPVKCIQVDSPSSLFLAGEAFTPTHNTAEIAGLVLVHLVGPEAELNGEIYSAATEREQAGQVYKMAAQMVRAEPELNSKLKCIDSTKTIVCHANGSFYRALSAEDGSKHGQNPTVVIYDELAQAKNTALYDVLDTSVGAREEPLMIIISTQSNDPKHILSELIDDGLSGEDPTIVCHLYAVEDEVADRDYCETCDLQFDPAKGKKTGECVHCGGLLVSAIYDEREWYKANPALGDFRSLKDMRAKASAAKRMPSREATFRNLYLNQRVDSTSPLIARAEWMACHDDAMLIPGESVYLGLDLSGTTDLTALIAVSADDTDRVQAWFWKPSDLVKEHETRDRVPYGVWRDKGYLDTPPGRAVNYSFVAARLAELASQYTVLGVAFDRWRIDNLIQWMDSEGIEAFVDGKDDPQVGALRLVPWGQGFKDMAPSIDALEISILERKLKHDGNPILTWCFSNAMAISDPSGNRKMDKSKTRFRIDGAVATAMAIGLKSRESVKVETSIYEERGVTAW